MIQFIIFGILCLSIKAVESDPCNVDLDDYNNTYISCHYQTELDKDIPLSEQIKPSEFTSLRLTQSSGNITESSLANLRQLTFISMYNVKLDQFILPDLPKLTNLNIQKSTIPKLAGALKNLKTLSGLSLHKNNFNLDDNSFKGLTSLERLSISKQNITITENMFKDLKSLERLIIDKANVEKIPSNAFQNNLELIELDLGRNPITSIEKGALDPLKKLQRINMVGTKLEKFDIEYVKELKELTSLGVPARSIKGLDLQKLLEYCPKLGSFHFLLNDSGCVEVNELLDKIGNSTKFIPVAYHGTHGKSC